MNTAQLLDEVEAGHYLGGVSPNTLNHWRATGRGPSFVKLGGGSLIRYLKSDLDEFIVASKVQRG